MAVQYRKFALNGDSGELFSELVTNWGGNPKILTQYYIDEGVRIRQVDEYLSLYQERETEYYFKYKRKINGLFTEFEYPISEEDFFNLKTVSSNKIHKVRVEMQGFGTIWNVDFFLDESECNILLSEAYFILAELRSPPRMENHKLPNFVIDHGIGEVVPADSNKFRNINLTNVENSRVFYNNLKTGKTNDLKKISP